MEERREPTLGYTPFKGNSDHVGFRYKHKCGRGGSLAREGISTIPKISKWKEEAVTGIAGRPPLLFLLLSALPQSEKGRVPSGLRMNATRVLWI